MVFLVSFSVCSLLVHRNVINFCVLLLYPMTLLNSSLSPVLVVGPRDLRRVLSMRTRKPGFGVRLPQGSSHPALKSRVIGACTGAEYEYQLHA